jgi:hypothetical protein
MIIKLTKKMVIAGRIREVGEILNVPDGFNEDFGKVLDKRKPEEFKKQSDLEIKSVEEATNKIIQDKYDAVKQDAISDTPPKGK